jgi:hypothetical protein
MITRRHRALIAAVCTATLLAGCKSQAKVGPTTVVTVTASASSAAGSRSAPPSSPAATTAGRSAPPPPVNMTKLPGRCENRLSDDRVEHAIGASFDGDTAFIVGLPDNATGRISYINCRYGVSGQSRQLEIQVSLYRTAAKAAARIRPTIDDFAHHSATATKTTVDGIPATVLDGGTGEGYGPTIVLAYGQRTLAVTFEPGAVSAARVARDLTALAALAVQRTGPR